jgi:hypothetical protein
MTQTPDNGGPAFPRAEGETTAACNGMTLRDYAVSKYTAAMLAHPTRYRPRDKDRHLHWHDAIISEANDLFDAQLRARKGGSE